MQALSPSKEQHAARRGRERASGYSRPDRTTPRAAGRGMGPDGGHPGVTAQPQNLLFGTWRPTSRYQQSRLVVLKQWLSCFCRRCAAAPAPGPLLARAQAHDAFEGHGALHTSPLPWSCHSRRSRHAGHVDKIISSAPFPGAAGEHAANSQRMPDCGRPTHPDPTSRGKAARFYYEPMIRLQS